MCKSKTTEKVHTRVFRIFFIHSCCLLLSFFFVDNPPIEATFRGTEYVTYDLSQKSLEPILSINDQISLYFKTRKSSGLLFYTGNTSKLKSLHLKGLEGEREKKATERLLYSMFCTYTIFIPMSTFYFLKTTITLPIKLRASTNQKRIRIKVSVTLLLQ